MIDPANRAASAQQHRLGVILAGEHSWAVHSAQTRLRAHSGQRILWVSQHPPQACAGQSIEHITSTKAARVLGQENDVLVFDSYSGFDPDAFAAVVGTLRGGGLLMLITPPLVDWPAFDDPEHERITVYPYLATAVVGRFLQRLAKRIAIDPDVMMIEQGSKQDWASSIAVPTLVAWSQGASADQRRAVAAIVRVARGHRHRPLVLSADRGRGKSAALGIAAAQLLRQGDQHIVITGPRLSAVERVFAHAHQQLPTASLQHGRLCDQNALLEFVPADELVRHPRPVSLLMVDEAAALSTAILEQLLKHYARIAFATTVHGYEGSGRGFELRFQAILQRLRPAWRALSLNIPMRWAEDDPLERFVARALLLDAAPAADRHVTAARAEQCRLERLDRQDLALDETTLRELFGLLVLAHYRTRPYDLRHLLDGPNIEVYVLRYQGHIVATALLAREGALNAEQSQKIYLGQRRWRGHLLAQSLAAHVGLPEAARLRYIRVMRIAVHPILQGQGLGSYFVQQLITTYTQQGYDGLGTSFGARPDVLRFWLHAGLMTVRLGLQREASSGEHSALLLSALSPAAASVCSAARQRFSEQLPHLLADALRLLEPELVRLLWPANRSSPKHGWNLEEQRDLHGFANAQRGYEDSLRVLWPLTCAALADRHCMAHLSTAQYTALIGKVLQKRSWGEVAELAQLRGRAQVIDTLRAAVRSIMQT